MRWVGRGAKKMSTVRFKSNKKKKEEGNIPVNEPAIAQDYCSEEERRILEPSSTHSD